MANIGVPICVTVSLFAGLCGDLARGAPLAPAILILLDRTQQVVVRPVSKDNVDVGLNRQGLILWRDGDHERWQVFNGKWKRPHNTDDLFNEKQLSLQSRSIGSNADSSVEVLQATTLLPQLRLPDVTKGPGGMVAPYDGAVLLDPQVTFRRKAPSANGTIPPAEAILRDGEAEIARVYFPANETQVRWSEIAKLPDELKAGLKPGAYQLELPTPVGAERVAFTIATAERRNQVLAASNALSKLLPTDSPVVAQVTVEELVAQQPPFLTDALATLDRVPERKRTQHLKCLHQHVLQLLADPGQRPGLLKPSETATGDEAIDQVRSLIASGSWNEALEVLDSLKVDDLASDQRRRALTQLYRGVILGESGAGRDEAAGAAFEQAIVELEGLKDAGNDLHRAHNNYANYLLGRAQDQVHNHAFQMATGAQLPLMTALDQWLLAQKHYARAAKFASSEQIDPLQCINQARLYSLLGDVIRTLSDPEKGDQGFTAAEEAAARQVQMSAEMAARSGNPKSLLTAVAHQILAQSAFRDGQVDEAVRQAELALSTFVDFGSLPGVENAHRFLGVCQRSVPDRVRAKSALEHFLISEKLSEILRDRYPTDEFGLSRAGFYARRAYVSEHIIDLLVAEGLDAEALHHAERSKARALQDTLAVRNLSTDEPAIRAAPDQLLTAWPPDTVALEYFLGSEHCWMFIIDRSGNITARTMTTADGKPLASRDLIARVRKLLDQSNPNGMDHYAQKLLARVRSQGPKGYDKEWQDELVWFREVLLPDTALAELKHAKLAVIVPHHILHYFPFAALVTERDSHGLTNKALPRPRFLIDEAVDLVYSPSLTMWRAGQAAPAARFTQVAASGIVELPGADVLPGVAADLEGTRRHFKGRLTDVLEAEHATESAVTRLLRKQGLLILAMHGNNQADQPLKSYLAMFPDDAADGALTAEEIYQSKVSCDLVVLSACYSGLADRSPLPGDDLFGLQRALLASGAKTVVSGLWDVFDKTSPELIDGFLERIARGEPAAHALAESQRAFLKKLRSTGEPEPYIHPYFWAVYTVAGDDRTSSAAEPAPVGKAGTL